MRPHKPRIIYSDDYYRAKKLVAEPLFQERVASLYAEYAELGVPVPADGLKKYEKYMDWLDEFWKHFSGVDQSKEARDLLQTVTKEVPHTDADYFRVMEQYEAMLPTVPGSFIDELLKEFGIDPKNEKFYDFVEGYIFLGIKELHEQRFEVTWKRNEKTDAWELYLRIFPYTKREDVMEFWDEVVKAQKESPEFIGKSKRWETFDRDLEIYKTWRKITGGKHRGHGRQTWIEAMAKPAADIDIYSELHAKYENLSLPQIRKAIARIGKLEHGMNG